MKSVPSAFDLPWNWPGRICTPNSVPTVRKATPITAYHDSSSQGRSASSASPVTGRPVNRAAQNIQRGQACTFTRPHTPTATQNVPMHTAQAPRENAGTRPHSGQAMGGLSIKTSPTRRLQNRSAMATSR